MKPGRETGAPRESLTERIYAQLKQSIFDFQLLPGDRFTESEIAKRMSASRTPVREALTQLQREGFVDVAFRSGWQVKPFDLEQYEQLYDVRLVLEQAAVQRLCEMNPEPDLGLLKQNWLLAPEHRLQDAEAFWALDERFHEQLVEATGNTELARIHHNVNQRLRIVRRIELVDRPRLEAIYEEHSRLLEAIIEHAGEEAQRLIAQHISTSKADVRKITLHMIFAARDNQDATLPGNSPED